MRNNLTSHNAASIRRLILQESGYQPATHAANSALAQRAKKCGPCLPKHADGKGGCSNCGWSPTNRKAGKNEELLDERVIDPAKTSRFTKSGKRVLKSSDSRHATVASSDADRATALAYRTSDPEDHATAAKAHLVAAFYSHHGGVDDHAEYGMKHQHLDYARMHQSHAKAAGHTGKTTTWVDKNIDPTHELIYGTGHQKIAQESAGTEFDEDSLPAVVEADATTPRFLRVTGKPFITKCDGCKKSLTAGDGHSALADTTGKAFQTYYHDDCAKKHCGWA